MLEHVTRFLGDDVLMYASDYPHSECQFPDSISNILDWKSLTEARRKKSPQLPSLFDAKPPMRYRPHSIWRGGRAAECAGFENRSARKGSGSSNLPLSVPFLTPTVSTIFSGTCRGPGICPSDWDKRETVGVRDCLSVAYDERLKNKRRGQDSNLRMGYPITDLATRTAPHLAYA